LNEYFVEPAKRPAAISSKAPNSKRHKISEKPASDSESEENEEDSGKLEESQPTNSQEEDSSDDEIITNKQAIDDLDL
jgi:hypothetical protein